MLSRLEDQAQFEAFVIRSYRSEGGGGCVQVLRNDSLAFSRQTGGRFFIANGFDEPGAAPAPAIPVGTDVTGFGKPNVVLSEWTGGGHCCYVFRVLELGKIVREVAAIDVQDAIDSCFVDLDHNGVFALVSRDYTFAYWRASFAESPAPGIILRFNGVGYDLALDLMRKPAPDKEEIDKIVAEVRQSEYPKPLLWKTMLDLIYTGNADLAWRFLPAAWPSTVTSRGEFLRGFCGQLANSPYFERLDTQLTNAPCVFDPKNGKRM